MSNSQSILKEKKKKRTVFLTVLAGAGADFLKIALTVTAIVCFLLNVDEKRVRYMKITTSDFGKWFTPSSPNFYLEDTKKNFSEIFFSSKRVAPRAFVIFFHSTGTRLVSHKKNMRYGPSAVEKGYLQKKRKK